MTQPGIRYTCKEYRLEMILAGLRKRLANNGFPEKERVDVEKEIRKLESEMGMD